MGESVVAKSWEWGEGLVTKEKHEEIFWGRAPVLCLDFRGGYTTTPNVHQKECI